MKRETKKARLARLKRESREKERFSERFFNSREVRELDHRQFWSRVESDFQRKGLKKKLIGELMFNLEDAVLDVEMFVYALRQPAGIAPAVRKGIIEDLLFHATNHLATAAFIYSDGHYPILHLDERGIEQVKANVAYEKRQKVVPGKHL